MSHTSEPKDNFDIGTNKSAAGNTPIVKTESFDLTGLLLDYLSHWGVFLLSIIICGAAAYYYCKTQIPTYTVSASIYLNDENSSTKSNAFNGLGLVNLGPVGPNFYADLKLLEEDGVVTLRSTPKLSTLNGHKAVLKSGEVKYYKESQVNIIGTQNPLQSESYLWKNVEASFVLDMTPIVSADSTITIRIDLNQDEFTERDNGDLTAPPGMTKRGFNSIVKVKDGEMILLGGIEKNLTEDSSKGLPWIARVPVLRLLCGNVTRTKQTQKLNVFIRPTIVL